MLLKFSQQSTMNLEWSFKWVECYINSMFETNVPDGKTIVANWSGPSTLTSRLFSCLLCSYIFPENRTQQTVRFNDLEGNANDLKIVGLTSGFWSRFASGLLIYTSTLSNSFWRRKIDSLRIMRSPVTQIELSSNLYWSSMLEGKGLNENPGTRRRGHLSSFWYVINISPEFCKNLPCVVLHLLCYADVSMKIIGIMKKLLSLLLH